MKNWKLKYHLLRDCGIIALSVLVALILAKNGIIDAILLKTGERLILGSFIAGMFFTSIFTTAPAIVALGIIAQGAPNIFAVALPGAFGALLGDLIIFRFLRDGLNKDIIDLIKLQRSTRIKALFKLKFFRWMMSGLGALVIASPLPDELGLMMMGLSKLNMRLFIPISLIFNFLGILAIGLVARGLLH